MGGKTKQTTNQNTSGTSTTSIDPAILGMQVGNYGRAQGIADQLGQGYSGPLSTSYDGTQLPTAITGAQGLLSYSPISVSPTLINRGSVSNVTPGQLASTDLSAYLNPYTSDVINTTAAQLARQNAIDNTNAAGQATAAGAFGGSRSAVLQNLNTDSYQRNLDQTLAGLNQANFGQAQQAALADIANRMAAEQANQGADLAVAGQNASAGNAASLANQAADLSGANIKGNATSLLGNLAQLQYGANQANIDRAYNAWLAQKQGLLSGQGLLNGTLAGVQAPQTTTGQSHTDGTTTTSQSPGIGQIFGGLGALAMGIGSGGLGFAPFAAGAAGGAASAGVSPFSWYGLGAGAGG